MTAHSLNSWSWEQLVTDELVAEIASNVEGNHQYNGAWGGYCPACFAIFSLVDQMVWNIGSIIDRSKGAPLDEQYIATHIPVDFAHRDKAIDLIKRTLTKMDLYGKTVVLERPGAENADSQEK